MIRQLSNRSAQLTVTNWSEASKHLQSAGRWGDALLSCPYLGRVDLIGRKESLHKPLGMEADLLQETAPVTTDDHQIGF